MAAAGDLAVLVVGAALPFQHHHAGGAVVVADPGEDDGLGAGFAQACQEIGNILRVVFFSASTFG